MKLKVCSRKGKQEFRRAGFLFTPNPIEDDVDKETAERILNEAMLIVSIIKEDKEIEKIEKIEEIEKTEKTEENIVEKVKQKIKFIPPKKGKVSKK